MQIVRSLLGILMMRFSFLLPAVALAVDIPTKEITAGVHMPLVSIGTGGLESSETKQIVTSWLALGGRGIDTAQHYNNQAVIRQAIAQSGVKREDLFITTKIPGCSNAQANIEHNFKQLGTDYVDLLLIHFPSGNDCTGTWETLEKYYKNGKAKAIGVSNFAKKDLAPILKIASTVPHMNQVELNVLEYDKDAVGYSIGKSINVEAYSPLGRSGHSGDISGNAVIQSVASNHNVSTYQVAMKWILQHGHLLTFQSTSQAHQKEDADVFGFTLTDDEMSKLDKLQSGQRTPSAVLLPAVALAMDIPTKEIAAGVHMPLVSIGTGGLERSETKQIVTSWLALGGRGIDTAHHYNNQAVIRQAITQSGVKREDLFITTKIPGCSNAQANIEDNFKQLGTDYVDLLLIHFPSGNDCTGTWKTLEKYYKNGKAKAIGVSNFAKKDLAPILKIASTVPHMNQVELNVLEYDKDAVGYSIGKSINVEAYSPLGRSGDSGDISGNAVIQSVASNHNVSTYQVAMKWILQHGHLLTFQSTSQAHQKEDADVFGFTITDDEMSKLDKLQSGQKTPSAVLV